MIRITDIQLAFDPDYYSFFRTPVWTFTFNNDFVFENQLEEGIFGVEPIFPSRRDCYDHRSSPSSPALNILIDVFQQEVTEMFPIVMKDQERISSQRWVRNSKDVLNGTDIHTKIFRDPPGFFMNPHIDNSFMIGNAIVNLVDNNNSTLFHDYRNPDKVLFEAPKEKNRGIFFLNTPGSLHSIKNDSDRLRYMINTSFFIKGLG